MSNINVVEVINLCDQFGYAADNFALSTPELKAKTSMVLAALSERFTQSIRGEVGAIPDELLSAGQDTLDEFLKSDVAFQDKKIETIEMLAVVYEQILNAEQLSECLPDGLRGKKDVADFLKEKGAPTMAKFCEAAPV